MTALLISLGVWYSLEDNTRSFTILSTYIVHFCVFLVDRDKKKTVQKYYCHNVLTYQVAHVFGDFKSVTQAGTSAI